MNAPATGIRLHRVDALPLENSFADLPPAFHTRLRGALEQALAEGP